MKRFFHLVFLISAAIIFPVWSRSTASAQMFFPVEHSEPITVRVLDGKAGEPIAHRHIYFVAGYDSRDLHHELWHEEALTDDRGEARLPHNLSNLPWVEVWVTKEKLCQAKSRSGSFSVEEIRAAGLSAPNQCGIAAVANEPGMLTIFVRGKSRPETPKALARSGIPMAQNDLAWKHRTDRSGKNWLHSAVDDPYFSPEMHTSSVDATTWKECAR